MNKSTVLILLISLLAISILGCSGSSPVTPPADRELTPDRITHTDPGRMLWGYWNVSIDPDCMTADVVPLRTSQFTANVTRFMQPPASPVHMMGISILPSSDPANGLFDVEVTLNHPFVGLNKFNGFDVRGIFITNGSVASDHDPTAIGPGESDAILLNPDGLTRWWNPTEFTAYNTIFGFTQGKLAPALYPTATINPYKYFADALDSTSDVTSLDPASRGFFTASLGINTRLYKIQFPVGPGGPVLEFQYAVDASWNTPDPAYDPDYPLDAFELNANVAEAWAIDITDAGSDAYYKSPTDFGGQLVLDIEVYDWQSMENPDGVSGEVSGIWLEGDVINGVYDVLSNATVLPGSTPVSEVFQVSVANLELTGAGNERIFVTVESADPDTYEPQVPGGDAFDYPDATLAAYATGMVQILSDTPGDPATVDILCPMWGFPGDYLQDISLEGADIVDGATVKIEHETSSDTFDGIDVMWVDSNTIEFDLDLTDAPIGYYTVIVTNPNSPDGILEQGFEVMDPDNLPTWPTIQGNSANTGMVGLYGPCDVHDAPTWDHNWQPNPYGNPLPIYLNEDTCFISNTGDGGPLPAGAVDLPSQSTLWNQQFNDDMQNWLNVKCATEDGSVVLTYESKYLRLVGLDGDTGDFMWEITGVEVRCDTFPVLDLDGNFIVPITDSGYISVVPSTGAINWNSNTGDMYYSQPGIGSNGRIYAYDGGQNSGRLMALDPSDGSVIWYSDNLGNCRANGVTVHPNGTLIIPTMDGLTCIQDDDDSASILWKVPYDCPFYSSVAIAPDETIIFVEWSGTLHRIDPDTGASIDSVTLQPGDTPSNRPAISKDGHIYLRTRNYSGNMTYFACYDRNLDKKWEWFHGLWIGDAGMPCAAAIGQDGTLYSSSRPYGIIAWKDD